MRIFEVKERTPLLKEQLLEVWEKSVRATHLFLSDTEIKDIKNYVPQAINEIAHLIVVANESKKPLAFIGIENYSIHELAVNEQNPSAKGFYEHMGFQVYKRIDYDEQGKPYPLLYMKLSW